MDTGVYMQPKKLCICVCSLDKYQHTNGEMYPSCLPLRYQ